MANKYLYNDIVLTNDNYDETTKMYNWVVKTNYFWQVEFKLEKYETPKVTQGWARIVGELHLSNGDKKGIFENERNGAKTYWATLKAKPNPLYVNLKPLLSSGPIKEYKVTFVEMEDGEVAALEAQRAAIETEIEF